MWAGLGSAIHDDLRAEPVRKITIALDKSTPCHWYAQRHPLYAAEDFDTALGTRGLHTVRRKVEWVERESVLPPELFHRFVNDTFWRVPGVTF